MIQTVKYSEQTETLAYTLRGLVHSARVLSTIGDGNGQLGYSSSDLCSFATAVLEAAAPIADALVESIAG